MTTINKYRLWCIEENTYVYSFAETEPTICPNNHADKSIDTSKTTIVQSIVPNTTIIQSDVAGYYQMATTTITVPTGATGSVYEQTISFPMDLSLWIMEFTSSANMVGDVFSIIAMPETTAGYVTAPVSIGDTVINTSSTIFTSGLIVKGMEFILDNGVTKQSLGLITALDTVNSQVTVQTPPTVAYAPGSLIKINTYTVRNQVIDSVNKSFIYGRKGFTTKQIPANSLIKFVYTNNNGLAKNMYFNLEYNYQ